MKFKEQAEAYIQMIQTRRRNPVKYGTVRIYQSYLDSQILPVLGDIDLGIIENGVAKSFINKLNHSKLAPTTINQIFKVVESVMSSAQDQNGNELYPRKWNHEFIDLPIISKSGLDTPIITPEQLNAAILAASGQDQALLVLLAATGARIGEILALKNISNGISSYWSSTDALIRVNSTLSRGKVQNSPKTESSRRDVDLHPDVNEYLKKANLPNKGYLFQNSNGTAARINTLYSHLEDLGIDGGFHAFRRFRITHLESQNVPRGVAMYWTGHAAKDIHETYIHIKQDLQTRKAWAVKAGLGFEVPKI